MTVIPGEPASAELSELPKPAWDPMRDPGKVLVKSIAVGLCGTDRELLGRVGTDNQRLTIGHEVLGHVVDADDSTGLRVGDHVVSMLRSECDGPCTSCRVGRFDRCDAETVLERGLHQLDGFGSDLWLGDVHQLVKVAPELGIAGVLVEPMTSVTKGLRRVGDLPHDEWASTQRAVIVGAGPIGTLTAKLLVDGGWDVTVVSRGATRNAEELIREAGAEFRRDWSVGAHRFDLAVECAGTADAFVDSIYSLRAGGTCLVIGICPDLELEHRRFSQCLYEIVARDIIVMGSINATRADFESAANTAARWGPDWLSRIIDNAIRPEQWPGWASKAPTATKTVVDFRQ